jgi:multidrug resistance efflux pump
VERCALAVKVMVGRDNLIESWLALQCSMLSGATQAVVLHVDADGLCNEVARWPEDLAASAALSNAAAAAAGKTTCSVNRFDMDVAVKERIGDIVTCPLSSAGKEFGVIAVQIAAGDVAQGRACAKALLWGLAWLNLLLDSHSDKAEKHLLTVIDMVATSLEHASFDESASALVAELARRVGCERVSLGFLRRKRARVLAMSSSASADSRMALLRAIGAAMDEAVDQDSSLVYPPRHEGSAQIFDAHENLLATYSCGSICTVPIAHDGQLIAAMTFEHQSPDYFDSSTVALCEAVVSLAGPILAGKRQEERWVGPRLLGASRSQLSKLTGAGHMGFKLAAVTTIAAMLFLSLATGEYRISADALVESQVQRAVTAPFDGYIDESSVRPGDIVKAGTILFRLEDRDLKLEELKWSSEAAKFRQEYREAIAAHENSRVRILQAQLEQASAQLELAEDQLARTQVAAPVDGMIVKGDLTQSLGAPVERGEVLFEVAPLDDYRVMLAVDEREVGRLSIGLLGKLALSGMPSNRLSIEIQRITPVSTAEDGKNFFAVQAKLLSEQTQLLRPGMQGIGKISVGQRKLIWIWTHDMLDWLRLRSWSWIG